MYLELNYLQSSADVMQSTRPNLSCGSRTGSLRYCNVEKLRLSLPSVK